jgi:hypothetical protein
MFVSQAKIALTGFGLIFKPHATARLRSPEAEVSTAHTARAGVPRLLKTRCTIITPGLNHAKTPLHSLGLF